ncbi:DUF2252 domain-containing protein [Craterilacuibacter sp. RT1T]|uniref:DUF2252 domain-containing protein n=1 Tax=Craterilacuibacter sp. RT1T TaxID=2942211 RepID=UPI0020C02C27|nr:DUF2252 domain-containing protein [Craterilacuibacter sp. RT1T]MCL6262315.1 DUF2252 domain-containing protein [Craterilacuibacter sp. RT1T]
MTAHHKPRQQGQSSRHDTAGSHHGPYRTPIDAAYLRKPAHLRTREERYEAGRALRVSCPRESHAGFTPSADRPDSVDILIASSEGRDPTLLPIRYGRMLASPFAFYRGAASIMASDLSLTPATGLAVQACGDCHLMNFGAFATPERRIVFDINDFDETYPAPWEWDLKRLAASFAIASHHNGHKSSDGRAAAAHVVDCYRDKLRELAQMSTLNAWYAYLDYEELIAQTEDAALRRRRKKLLEKALARDSATEFVKLAHMDKGQPRIKDMPPLIYHLDTMREAAMDEAVRENLRRYRESLPPERRMLFDRYELADIAIKVVGVGSVGTLCAIALFFAAEEDALFLQVKEARSSVLAPYVDVEPFASNGERVVFGQRLMQAASDVFLGHLVGVQGRQMYIRQLRDVKVKPMVEIFSPGNMLGFARNTGWALARAHARSGDAAVIAGYIGKSAVLADAIAEFALDYAAQNERDFAALREAARLGRVDFMSEDI